MSAGPRRYRVEIQEPAIPGAFVDEFGQPAQKLPDGLALGTPWKTIAVRWASITPVRGHKAFHAEQVQPDRVSKINIRYFAGLTPRHRLLYQTRIMNIEWILDVDERHIEMDILVREET